MAKLQFDKKQLIPAVGMGVASAALFTYFVLKMTTPPPLQAAIQPVKTGPQIASSQGGPATPGGPNNGATPDAASTDPLLTAPTAGMRDPFVPAIFDSGPQRNTAPVQMATSNLGSQRIPGIPTNLPQMGNLPPMSVPPGGNLPGMGIGPPAQQWTVTGVLSESSEPHNRVAILRSGDVRRFVRLGDMVDGSFRLVDVNRNGVIIADGAQRIHLSLGGDKKPSEKHSPVQSGAATGPWTGGPTSSGSSAAPGATAPAAAPAQPAPTQAPAQTPAAVPGPDQAAPTGGVL